MLPSREQRQLKIRFVDYGKVSFCKYSDVMPATKYTNVPIKSHCGKLQGTLIVSNFNIVLFILFSNRVSEKKNAIKIDNEKLKINTFFEGFELSD